MSSNINPGFPINRLTVFGTLLLLFLSGGLFAQHGDDPEMQGEHDAAMNLVPVSAATHTASADGNWTSGSTWNTGSVPGAGARVVIPQGRNVVYNSTSTANLAWIRVEGTLRYATNQNTVLNVETIVTTPTGVYEQGTASNPIPANYTSTVTFVDNGAITDAYKLARGLLAHGRTRIHGAAITPFLKTSSGMAAGATQATLASVPSNWKVGDQVAITGMRLAGGNPYIPQDEIKTISAISGSTVTFNSGLTYMRKVDFATWGVLPYVANTSRNIRYRSANTTDHSRKGHVMFMHNPDVDVRYAGFYDLGRTRKDIPVTDSETAALPSGDNPRGKYALHFHRTGHKNASLAPAYVVGCAVVNSPGWGYVNHDSYVNFEDNVSYNVSGAHFVLENGAERGAFRRNIAIRAPGGSGRFIKTGVDTHDLAHSGHGFWFQGGNYIAENNVASGCLDGGFTWFARSNAAHNSAANQFVPASLLLDPAQAGGRAGYHSSDLPIMSHKNNTALACYHGMIAIDVEINGTGPTNTLIENFVSLNAAGYSGIMLEYYRNFTFRNTKVLRDNDYVGNQWHGNVGIQAHNLIDHLYPFQTRSADRAIGLIVRNYLVAVKNFENSTSDGRGEAVSMAKWQVIGPAIDHNCPDGAFNNTGTYNGVPLVQNIASESEVVPLPVFSPAAGTYASGQSVSISSVAGATIYYVIGTQGYVSPSLESQLKSGSWTQYTGPVTVSQNRKLIAVAVRNGQYSRINSGFFTIDPNAGPTAPAAPTGLTATAGNGQVSLSWSGSSGATSYSVWARTGSSGSFTNVASPTAISYTHTGLTNGTPYTYYVTASNSTGTSAASAQASATPTSGTSTTTVTREYWSSITGTAVSAIPVTTAPTGTSQLSSLEGPTNFGDNYGTRIRAYIKPTTTGSYTFYLSGDDDCELWLSTDANPANKVRIANVTGWTSVREWNKYPSQTSAARSLTANTNYYVEVLHKEGAGGDNVAVGWTGPGISTISVIGNANLAPYTGTTTPPPTSTTTTLTPVADTDTQSDVTAGTNATLNASRWNTMFVKFSLSGVSGTVSSAKLRVYTSSTNTGTLNVSGASPDSWTEGGSKPTAGSLITTGTLSGTAGYVEVDVTSTVNAEAAGDDLVTFALTTSLDSWSSFNARENTANKPQLVVTYGSSRIGLQTEAVSSALRVYPNPSAGGVVHVRFPAAAAGDASLVLTNALGQSALKDTFAAQAGENTRTLSTRGVAAGLYLLTLQQGNSRRVIKVYIK